MQSFESIQPEDFNLEGIIYSGDNWYLFNRGNESNSKTFLPPCSKARPRI
jgi:hypothetical protein